MDKYNLIIIILIIILILLFLWINIFQNKPTTEGFTVIKHDDNTNSFGNLLVNVSGDNSLKLNKQYKLTGIYTTGTPTGNTGNYTFNVNNGLISYNADTNLETNKYYDISSLNIKAKSFELTPNTGTTINENKIYGLGTDNTMTKSNYDNLEKINTLSMTISNSNTTNPTYGLIKFNNDYEHLVYYIKFPVSTGSSDIEVQYKNQFTNTDSGFDILESGITDLDNKYHKSSTKIYFDKPILASQIKLVNYKNDNTKTDTTFNTNNVIVYGKIATNSDINSFKLKTTIDEEDNLDININGQKCPPMKDIINRQKQINDLCNSITEKDKIRNQQTNYEKTKKYISKLKAQEAQIQALRAKLDTLMMDTKNTSASFQEKVSNLQGLINDVNINNPFNKVDINYKYTPEFNSNVTTTTTTNSST